MLQAIRKRQDNKALFIDQYLQTKCPTDTTISDCRPDKHFDRLAKTAKANSRKLLGRPLTYNPIRDEYIYTELPRVEWSRGPAVRTNSGCPCNNSN